MRKQSNKIWKSLFLVNHKERQTNKQRKYQRMRRFSMPKKIKQQKIKIWKNRNSKQKCQIQSSAN